MIQSIFQNGLGIENISPLPGSLGASVYTLIKLTFNSELNTGSISNNIVVFEDPQGKYIDINSIKNTPALFPKIEGTFTYKDRVITFTPSSPLKNSVKYIIAIKPGTISDIYGNIMVAERYFHFVSESDDVEAKVDIIRPAVGGVVPSLPEIAWTSVGSDAYYIEVSSQQTFETTVYATVIKKVFATGLTPNTCILEIDLQDGLFYIRVRAMKGPWSEPVQIFIKKITAAITSQEDLSEFIQELDLNNMPLELLEVYPEQDDANLALSLGMTYFKFKGFIEFNAVDLFGSSVEMISMENDTGIPVEVQGQWIHVYDEKEDVTYLIFQIEK